MKKRYYLTLTKETVEGIRQDMDVLRLPPNALSGLIDEWLEKFQPCIHKMAVRKLSGQQLTFDELIGDLFVDLGQTMKEG